MDMDIIVKVKLRERSVNLSCREILRKLSTFNDLLSIFCHMCHFRKDTFQSFIWFVEIEDGCERTKNDFQSKK